MSDLAQSVCRGGSSRRHFLKAAAAGGAMGALGSEQLSMAQEPAPGSLACRR